MTIDRAGLDHLQRASVRLSPGSSASAASAQGLVLTNNLVYGAPRLARELLGR